MDLVLGKLVGRISNNTWAQVYDFVPGADGRLLQKGRLVAVVGLTVNQDAGQVEMVQTGREILTRIHELYFGGEHENPLEGIRMTMETVSSEFEGVDLGCVAIVENVVYTGTNNNTSVWVYAGDKQGWLVNNKDEYSDRKIQVFSGKGKNGQMIILGNNRFWKKLSEETLKQIVAKAQTDFDEAVETFNTIEHGDDTEGGEVGAILKLESVLEATSEPMEEAAIPEPVSEETNEDALDAQDIKTKGNFSLAGKLTQLVGGLGQKIYLRHGDRQMQRQKMMKVGLVLLALMLFLAGTGQVINKKNDEKKEISSTKIEKLMFDFEEAKAMTGLNPIRSKQLLDEITVVLSQLSKDESEDHRVVQLKNEIDKVQMEVKGEASVTPEEVVSLDLIRQGMVGSTLAILAEKLEVLDSVNGRIAEVDIKTGSGSVVAGGDELKDAKLLVTYPGKLMVLTAQGIVEVKADKKTNRVKQDFSLERVKDVKMWAGNIYLLETDGEKGEIWKYQASGEAFGQASRWTADQNKSSLAEAISMAIDGNVWVLKKSSDLMFLGKYTRGVEEILEITNLDKPVGVEAKIFTDDQTENIYILDKDNSRILSINKGGAYEKQFLSDQLGKAIGNFVVNEKEGVAYFLSDNKIWKVKITP